MALHAGDKTTIYGRNPLVGAPETELIKAEGTRVDDGIINGWNLHFGKVTSQMDSLNPEIAAIAKNLHTVIMANPSNFILAEQRALEKLGIETRRVPVTVSYHIKSSRVSVSWIWVATGDNAIKLAILAPSNDVIKRGKLGNWLRKIPLNVERITADLKGEGMEPHQWWN